MALDAEVTLSRGRLDLDVGLAAPDGGVVAVLGPNGAGKTTLLQALAGLVPLDGGRVRLDGRTLEEPAAGTRVPAAERGVGMVFQDLLLFPHLSVRDNVAFGLRTRGVDRHQARRRAETWLGRVGLAGRGGDDIDTLSGGQARRVALARALAPAPDLLLLDEPLAGLDVHARQMVREVVAAHVEDFPGVGLLVTHDPLDALVLADHLVVVEDGGVTQAGTPAEVSRHPRSDWVARLVGVNLYRGTARGGDVRVRGGGTLVAAGAPDGPVLVVVHPHSVSLHRTRPAGTPRNVWRGDVTGLDRRGDRIRVHVAAAPPVVAEVTPAAVSDLDLASGGEVWAAVKATEVEASPA